MQRIKKSSVMLLLLFILFPAATSLSKDIVILEKSHQAVIEEFIQGIIDKADEPGTSIAERDELLKKALNYAETYSIIKGENALYKKIQRNIITSPSTAFSGDEAIIKEFQEHMLRGGIFPANPALRGVKKKVRQQIEGFIEAIIENALEPSTSPANREGLLEAATGFADIYARKTGNKLFSKRTRQLVQDLPPTSISSDDEIIEAFQKALLHDNRLVMEFLVKKVEPRIEPFVMAIITEANKPGTPSEKKEVLLTTAMNFAKTYGNIKGDQTFHRVIHRKTFTSRLSEPVSGIYVIDAPRASETAKNVFRPDNIVIRAGESVQWTNNDDTSHVIGTLDFLSDGRFFAPNIGPLETFEHRFYLPGEYYYICFIHNSMVGKITVEE